MICSMPAIDIHNNLQEELPALTFDSLRRPRNRSAARAQAYFCRTQDFPLAPWDRGA